MPSTLNSLRTLSDPTRARLMNLLQAEELSVAEIQEVLGMGQSRISTHLARLAVADMPEAAADRSGLKHVIAKRRNRTREYFNKLAGKFGRSFCPGRSWQSLAHLLITLIPAIDVADLGAGEGTLSQLLAKRARKVIAIDISERMIEVATQLAKDHGFT